MKKETNIKSKELSKNNKIILEALNKIWQNKKKGEVIFEYNR